MYQWCAFHLGSHLGKIPRLFGVDKRSAHISAPFVRSQDRRKVIATTCKKSEDIWHSTNTEQYVSRPRMMLLEFNWQHKCSTAPPFRHQRFHISGATPWLVKTASIYDQRWSPEGSQEAYFSSSYSSNPSLTFISSEPFRKGAPMLSRNLLVANPGWEIVGNPLLSSFPPLRKLRTRRFARTADRLHGQSISSSVFSVWDKETYTDSKTEKMFERYDVLSVVSQPGPVHRRTWTSQSLGSDRLHMTRLSVFSRRRIILTKFAHMTATTNTSIQLTYRALATRKCKPRRWKGQTGNKEDLRKMISENSLETKKDIYRHARLYHWFLHGDLDV